MLSPNWDNSAFVPMLITILSWDAKINWRHSGEDSRLFPLEGAVSSSDIQNQLGQLEDSLFSKDSHLSFGCSEKSLAADGGGTNMAQFSG